NCSTTSSLASVSTFCTADISKLSFSISSSLKCLYTSAETSGPMEIKRIAAFCLPVSCLVLAIVLSSRSEERRVGHDGVQRCGAGAQVDVDETQDRLQCS